MPGQKANYGKPPCLALVAQSRGWRPIIEANCRKNQIAGRIWIVASWWFVKILRLYFGMFQPSLVSKPVTEKENRLPPAVSIWMDQKSEPWTCENGVDLVYPGAFRYCKCGRFLTMPFTRSVQSGLKTDQIHNTNALHNVWPRTTWMDGQRCQICTNYKDYGFSAWR